MLTKAKIVASIGPASSDRQTLTEMINAGMNVVRLNFSHGNYKEQLDRIELIRDLQNEMEVDIAMIADLQGPKLRLGDLPNEPVIIKPEEIICFAYDNCDDVTGTCFKVNYSDFAKDVQPGNNILIDDGKIKLQAFKTDNHNKVWAKVIYGGEIFSRKGINLPDSKVSMPSMTEKDKSDVEFAVEHNVDWIALSFVRKKEDIEDLRAYVTSLNGKQGLIAKIEKPEAVENIDEIIEISDGIMVARGDLGVEVDFNKVPVIQKSIVSKCVRKAKPVIIATQMLDSMINNFRPTRAEANDVANAVMDLADAVMLSAETAVGKFPVETIRSMKSIISHTEIAGVHFNRNHPPKEKDLDFISDSVCYNVSKMAQQTGAKAIITFTHSGYTAYQISSHRPEAAIFAFTYNKYLLKKLPLIWGVDTYYFPDFDDIDNAIAYSIKKLLEDKKIKPGDVVIHAGSTPLTSHAKTNMIKLSIV